MIVSLNAILIEILFSFIFCFYANNVTLISSQFGDVVYAMPWYEMPIENQKNLPLIIRRSQVMFHFDGLGIIDCSMPTFYMVSGLKLNVYLFINIFKCEFYYILKKYIYFQLLKTDLSYFIILRQLNN